jgi:hypothetical protein
MLDIYIDRINSSNNTLEFHIDKQEIFDKVKCLLKQLERSSHFVDSGIAPFFINVFSQKKQIIVKKESRFLFIPFYKDDDNFIDNFAALLRINDIMLHLPKLKVSTTEASPLIGKYTHNLTVR